MKHAEKYRRVTITVDADTQKILDRLHRDLCENQSENVKRALLLYAEKMFPLLPVRGPYESVE